MTKEKGIGYHNKDIISKIFGDNMRGKSLSAMGWETDLTVCDILPTNLPALQLDELRMDNLFQLSDGSLAIIDYESVYKKSNMIKYMTYVVRVLGRSGVITDHTKIRVMVLYTADVQKAPEEVHIGCMDFHIEAAYLTGVDSEQWMSEIRRRIEASELDEETMMHMILLPLTYQGREQKNEAISACVELAKRIGDDDKGNFILAGLLSFTDKIISDEIKDKIKEAITMTKVGQMLIEEGERKGERKGIEKGKKEAALGMLAKGFDPKTIADCISVSAEQIEAWRQESCGLTL